MKTSAVLLFILSGIGCTAFAQRGLVIYKDKPWDADQFARATLYKELDKHPTVHNIQPMTGAKERVSSSLVQKDVPFPTAESLADIAEDAQARTLEATVADWTATMKRFPQSAKHLKPRLATIQADLAEFRAGKVKVAGVWMTPEALAAKRKQEAEERARIAKKLEMEALATANAAAEWEKLDAAGRARARMAKAEAEEAALIADEEMRLQAAIRQQKERAEMRAKMTPAQRLVSDEWVVPPELNPELKKDFEETLKTVAAELAKNRERIGFGRESQKLVLISPDKVIAFPPQALSPEIMTEHPDPASDLPPRLVLTAHQGKEVVEVRPLEGDGEPQRLAGLAISTPKDCDREKLMKGLSHLIELCGGKWAAKKNSEEEAKTEEAPAAPQPASAEIQAAEPKP
jgi:hypothetical protein